MPRPMWSGSISFGLVNIPIKMYSAVKRQNIAFNQLRASDGCRIRLKKLCSADGQEVANDNIVKGYEISPDRYVVVSKEELEQISPVPTHSIDIQDFVSLAEIDPVYYENSYYLVPDKGASKAYTLLLTAMQQTGKVAIARLVLRAKQYLAAVRPMGNGLALETMFFADEVVEVSELPEMPHLAEPDERELQMAKKLVETLSADFEPSKYKDEYRAKVMELIDSKAAGQQLVESTRVDEPGGKVIDLMAALEASLKAMPNKKTTTEKPRKKKSRAQ